MMLYEKEHWSKKPYEPVSKMQNAVWNGHCLLQKQVQAVLQPQRVAWKARCINYDSEIPLKQLREDQIVIIFCRLFMQRLRLYVVSLPLSPLPFKCCGCSQCGGKAGLSELGSYSSQENRWPGRGSARSHLLAARKAVDTFRESRQVRGIISTRKYSCG